MIITKTNNRYHIDSIKDKIPGKSYKGIAGYGKYLGWILSKLGYAIALKDDHNKTFYLNRKSAINWLQRHGCPLSKKTNGKQVLAEIKACANRLLQKDREPREELPEPPISLQDLPKDAFSLIQAELTTKELGILAMTSEKMRDISIGKRIVQKLKYYSEHPNKSIKSFPDEDITNNKNFTWEVVQHFNAEDRFMMLVLLSRPDFLLSRKAQNIYDNQNYYTLLRNLSKGFLAEIGLKTLKENYPEPEQFWKVFDQFCSAYACLGYDSFLADCFERVKQHYPQNNLAPFYQKLPNSGEYLLVAEVLKYLNNSPHAADVKALGSLGLFADKTFGKVLAAHLPLDQYNLFFRIPMFHPSSAKRHFRDAILARESIENDKLRALFEAIFKTHCDDDTFFKLNLRELPLVAALILGIKTEAAFKIALQSIPQNADVNQRRWYLQALTKGLQCYSKGKLFETIAPVIEPAFMERALQELGIQERPDQPAPLGNEEYIALFKDRPL